MQSCCQGAAGHEKILQDAGMQHLAAVTGVGETSRLGNRPDPEY